ncbi:MAG: hypothetical protein IKM76_07090, partial [Prevotella sp.]|nr:hypothetical protein [Prevotella sp.]
MRITTIIAKTAEIIGKTMLFTGLIKLEPTPEPTPWQKAPVYRQKAGVYDCKPGVYVQKAPGYGHKAPISVALV